MSKTNMEVATITTPRTEPVPFNAFGNIADFESVQRMATMLSQSSIVPDTYKGANHLGDCVIALEISHRIGASVLAVMQNLYIVYGKPAWSSQFLISCINASRKFSPLRYQMTGTPGDDSYGCRAWATDASGERLEAPEVTIGMAKAEGWLQKNGSKWKTMPELMLRYRTATLFARLYAPELTMGIQSDDEIIDITPGVTDPVGRAKPLRAEVSFVPPSGVSNPTVTATVEATAPEAKPDKTETKAAAAPSAPAKSQAQSSPELSQLQNDMVGFLDEQGVSFEDFRGWLKSTGRQPNACDAGSMLEIRDSIIRACFSDASGLKKLVTLYGSKK